MQSERDIHIAKLIIKQLRGELEPGQEQELKSWLDELEANRHLVDQMMDETYMQQEMERFFSFDPGKTTVLPPVRRQAFKNNWLKYAAAILILFGIVAWLWNNRSRHTGTNTPIVRADTAFKKIVPGRNRATLTLADGSIIDLDSANNGHLANQQGVLVTKKDGSIVYERKQTAASHAAFNTMSTPRGGQFQLTLPDGTRVWLNAESSITFPTQFRGRQRVVSIKGEVYFEVARNLSSPFIVKTEREEISVLGTFFNVHAYDDEPAFRITLVEGAVKIGNKMLKPGQAYLDGKLIPANIQQDIAWKNGYFDFEGADLKTVLKQLSRWYNLEIVYPQSIPSIEFGGRLKRNLSFSQIIKVLENSEVHFQLEGSKLIIKP